MRGKLGAIVIALVGFSAVGISGTQGIAPTLVPKSFFHDKSVDDVLRFILVDQSASEMARARSILRRLLEKMDFGGQESKGRPNLKNDLDMAPSLWLDWLHEELENGATFPWWVYNLNDDEAEMLDLLQEYLQERARVQPAERLPDVRNQPPFVDQGLDFRKARGKRSGVI